MGYRIDYGPVKKVRGIEKRTSRLAVLTGMFLLLFVALVCSFWPEGTAVLRDWLLPGDPAVTAAAIDGLTESLRTGGELSDSLRAFCVQILEGAVIGTSG